jgi:hypothetical protein
VSPIHLGIGVLCAGLVIVPVGYMIVHEPADTQRLLVTNDFEDAACTMTFYDSSQLKFSIANGGRYERTFRRPKAGFVEVECLTASGTLEAPNSFHLRNGGLATLTLRADGAMEAGFRISADR